MVLRDADLSRRAPSRMRLPRLTQPVKRPYDEVVIGFHFVCVNEQGLVRNGDGTAWTGTWVVGKVHADRASNISSYLALHSVKSEPSYVQGIIRDFRRRQRERSYAEDRKVQTERGIDFLIELTNEFYEWVGDGAGEKGYAWGKC